MIKGNKHTRTHTHTHTHTHTLAQRDNDNNDNKQQKLKIIRYNPSYSPNFKTNIGKTYLNLIKKHFPKATYIRTFIRTL